MHASHGEGAGALVRAGAAEERAVREDQGQAAQRGEVLRRQGEVLQRLREPGVQAAELGQLAEGGEDELGQHGRLDANGKPRRQKWGP